MTRPQHAPPTGRPAATGPSRRQVLAGALGVAGAASISRPEAAEAAAAPGAAGARAVPPVRSGASGLPFMLGASGDGVASGEYAAALGRGLDLAGTWADTDSMMTSLPQLEPGGEFAGWKASLDIALGAFDRGGTWAAAAAGSYDARWRTALTQLAALRSGATGTTFVRFAHEMNGNWYPWSVTTAQAESFRTAWARFRAIQLAVFPAAQLVFCANQNTVGYDAAWTTLFPGSGQADVLGVGLYNHYPYLPTAEAFADQLDALDGHGAPVGLRTFARYAASVGLPLALPEWSAVADATGGDAPAFIDGMHWYFTAHAGSGPGQVLYACQFNVSQGRDASFNLLVGSRLPLSSARYQALFGR